MRLQDSDEGSPGCVLSGGQSPAPRPWIAFGEGPSLAEREPASAPSNKKKRREDGAQLSLMEERTAALVKITECMEAQVPDDSAAFGSVVAGYLRSMPLATRAKCQMAVLSAITPYLE